jgi:very-short-patch-repair endonuclease
MRARDERWYRIPVESAHKWLKNRWPPSWLAFYQTKVFKDEAYAINYFSKVHEVREVSRQELFPNEPDNEKTARLYYQLVLGAMQTRPEPIVSHRWRRITFICTTWQKFLNADEINDLYDESPLEDQLWTELKRLGINAERQEFIKAKGRNYALDFAVYCTSGNLDLETDGDTWHADPKRIPDDNRRDNDLETIGWKLLRFNTMQINEQMTEYCIPTIVENISNLGGLEEGRLMPRSINPNPSAESQLSLFDDQVD